MTYIHTFLSRFRLFISIFSLALFASPAFIPVSVAATTPIFAPSSINGGASNNWAGYVASGSAYTAVSGAWTLNAPLVMQAVLTSSGVTVGLVFIMATRFQPPGLRHADSPNSVGGAGDAFLPGLPEIVADAKVRRSARIPYTELDLAAFSCF